MSETTHTPDAAHSAEKAPSLVERLKGDVDGQGAQMTFMEHLLELRKRLWTSALVIFLCMGLAMVFYKPLVNFLRWPADHLNERYAVQYEEEMKQYKEKVLQDPNLPRPVQKEIKLISTKPMEVVLMIMWLSIGAGLVLSSPVLIYQLWAFVAPGLREKEKRAIKPVLYGGILFFLAGCALAYFVLFPFSVQLFCLLATDLKLFSWWTMDEYSSLLLNMMALCGLVCETPLVVAGLAKLGVLKPGHLTQYWRFCIFGAFALGACFSPGTDIMSMLLFSALLLSLYVASIIMAYIFYPKAKATADAETPA